MSNTTPNNELTRVELETRDAIAIIKSLMMTEEVDTLLIDDVPYVFTPFADLYTANEYGVCKLIGLDETEEEACFVLYREPSNSDCDDGYPLVVPVLFPIRTSYEDAKKDYEILVADKMEVHKSLVESR